MYSAISGLRNHQVMLDVVGNDLANVNTLGFKGNRVTFADSLAQLQRGATGATATQGGQNAAQIGLGVQLGSIDNLMQSGALQATGNPLDIAISGDGWFRVTTSVGGPIEYTRAGNFGRNTNGDLVTQDGFLVVGRNFTAGPPPGPGATDIAINVPTSASNIAVAPDGLVSYDDALGVRQTAGYISLAKLPNEAGMERSGASRWATSPSSGAEIVGTPGAGVYGKTISGAVEMSNVDMATEFTNMITAQRGFQASSRVISVADQMLQDLVNLQR
ncbi:MAG TPA: flagellar hook-basal body complex protein [Solirubrobacteraceae bacterium]|nr:flagellar hook-basal body complex protein [Solirubrobacteraceae bacterium]